MKSSSYLSVVMATHNRATLLPVAANSILQQSFKDIELIIIDDASQDGTPSVLDQLQQTDDRIKAVHLPKNVGPGAARNVGLKMARGKYLAIMDDDDISLSKRFEKQLAFFEQTPALGLVFSPVAWVNHQRQVLNLFPGIAQRGEFPQNPRDAFRLLYLESNKIPNTTIMVRREVFQALGGYPEHPWVGEDWFWFMQMAAMGVKMAAISEPLVHQMRDRSHDSLMVNKAQAFVAQRQVLKMIRSWLKDKKCQKFDNLHRLALSNKIVREARFWSSIKGLLLCQKALFFAPTNAFAWETLFEICGRGWEKMKGKVGHYER